MNYLLFNNEIFISDGQVTHKIEKGSALLKEIDKVRLCCVDVDVLIAASVEHPLEKKDSILVRKFKEFYQHEAYIIQDERIDHNLFQVIGIKEQKLREVYSLIPPQRVESFIPYGIALRNTLIHKNIDLNRSIVFVDVLENEKLLTVFDGFKFSRTRVMANEKEDILPEIKRSQIDFFKKTEEFSGKKNIELVIIVNHQVLADEILKNTEKIKVEYLNVPHPALEGLKIIDPSINYRLPEENLKKKREIELKKKVRTSIISLGVAAAGFIFFLLNRVELGGIKNQCERTKQTNKQWNDQLDTLDKETYREDLMAHKTLNYGVSYLSMLETIPASYTVDSFKFYKTGQWNMEMIMFADEDGILEPIPRIKILKNAEIKDIFVNNQPGKHLKIIL